jgi:hypothetical protein
MPPKNGTPGVTPDPLSSLCAADKCNGFGTPEQSGDRGPDESGGATMAPRTDSQTAPLIVHGSRALALPKPSRRYEDNRYCSHPGCETRLSAYNAYETCFNHTFPWSARKTASAKRPRRRPAAAAAAVAEVVEVGPVTEVLEPQAPPADVRGSSRIAS